MTRLNANGSFDTSFGSNGKITTAYASGNKVSAGLQADGEIILIGNWTGNDAFNVARFNSDGVLHNSFGTNGIVITSIASNTGVSYAVTFQIDGKILVGGLRINVSNPGNLGDFIGFRYNPNGRSTRVLTATATRRLIMRDAAQSLVVQPNGKIIAAGLATVASGDNGNAFEIARFNPSGSLDPSFGTAVKIPVLLVNAFIDQINDRYPLILQPNGKIVVGRTRYATNQNSNRL